MTNMPERIWATPFDSEFSSGGTYCDAAERPTAPNHDAWGYIRADASYDAMAFLYKKEISELKAQCEDLARMSDNWMRIAEMEEENNEQMRKALFELSDDCNWYTSYDSFSNEAVTSWRGNSEPDRIAYTALNPEKNKE